MNRNRINISTAKNRKGFIPVFTVVNLCPGFYNKSFPQKIN